MHKAMKFMAIVIAVIARSNRFVCFLNGFQTKAPKPLLFVVVVVIVVTVFILLCNACGCMRSDMICVINTFIE